MFLVFPSGPKEDEVPEKIGRQKRLATGVERLEDDLSVVVAVKVDCHHLQRRLEGFEALFNAISQRLVGRQRRLGRVSLEELRKTVVKEEIGLHHSRARLELPRILASRQRMKLLQSIS
ncbi:hypothetical protein D3C72_1878110 [compost metagenome]